MQIWKENGLKIGIKDKKELQSMREGGEILGKILSEMERMIAPGITCLELDQKAEAMMKSFGVLPSFKGYHGYPNVLCSNVNDHVVHGIPTNYALKEGDIITVDCGVVLDGFHTDSAINAGVGKVDAQSIKLMQTAEKALEKAIEAVKPGIRIRTISGIIEDIVIKNGFSVVHDLIGHGVGKKLHEDPPVPNFRDKDIGPMLQPGMTIAIEPIITAGLSEIVLMKDRWTYRTKDGSRATQVEHSIAVTEKGAEILTKRST